MNKIILGLLPFFFFARLEANALVEFPSGPAAWTVSTEPSQNNKDPHSMSGNMVAKVEVLQNESIRSNNVIYYSGASRVTWEIVGTNLLLTKDPHGMPFLTPVTKGFFVPYLSSVFDWLTPETLVEKKPISYKEKLCFHYKGPSGEAWVDSVTLYPVALDDGTKLATFTFRPAPDTDLTLPPEYKDIVDHYKIVMGIHRAAPTR